MGRIPFGIYLSLLHKPLKIILGSGASCIVGDRAMTRSDCIKSGKQAYCEWEADFSLKYLIDNFDRLLEFEKIRPLIDKIGGISNAENYIKAISQNDTSSKDTLEEIQNALIACDELSIRILLRVTNPSHEPRCVSIQNDLLKNYSGSVEHIFLIPCETDFLENEKVLVFEPPSGPIKKGEKNHCKILKPYFDVDDNVRKKFLELAEGYFSRYAK